MSPLALGILSLVLTFYANVPSTIERAFLDNDAGRLATLFSAETPLLISLPEPLSFSDLVARDQAERVFERIFRSYPALEFFLESGPPPAFEGGGFLIRARWSIKHRTTGDLKPFRIFLRLKPERRAGRARPPWAIVEIRAEAV